MQPLASVDTAAVSEDLLSKADQNTEYGSDAVTLKFDGDGVTPSSTDGITVSEGKITITKGGDYVLSGTLDDGCIEISLADETEKVHLIFSGVSLTCKNGAPLVLKKADKVIITLADDTDNTVYSGPSKGSGTFRRLLVDENKLNVNRTYRVFTEDSPVFRLRALTQRIGAFFSYLKALFKGIGK